MLSRLARGPSPALDVETARGAGLLVEHPVDGLATTLTKAFQPSL